MRKLTIFFFLLFSIPAFSQTQIVGRKPLLGTQVNWSHPLSQDFMGWLFNENGGSQIYGIGEGSTDNDRVLVVDPTVTWTVRENGPGLSFDNTNPGKEMLVPALWDNPGFWLDSFTGMTIFVVAALEIDNAGPMVLFEIGDSTNGIVLGYRNGPNTFTYRVEQSGNDNEIQSTTTFVPNVEVAVCARWDRNAMELWVNGVSEGTATGVGAAISPTTGGGIGAEGEAESAFGVGAGNEGKEWGGVIILVMVWHQALSNADISSLFSGYYYAMFEHPLYGRMLAAAAAAAAAVERRRFIKTN